MLRQPGFEPSDDGTVWGFYWGGGGIENNPGEAKTGDYLAYVQSSFRSSPQLIQKKRSTGS